MSEPKPRVLVTAFEPFGGEALNSSQQVLSCLNTSPDYHLKKAVLPVVFGESADKLRALLVAFQPNLVLCLGQAGGRAEVSLERVAVNLDDARIPDNSGVQRADCKVIEGAPDAYFSRLPLKRVLLALAEKGIPCKLSMTAGTFVCNHLMFALLDNLDTCFSGVRGGFIHLPFLPEQAVRYAAPSLTLQQQTLAVETCIAVCLKPSRDIALALGETH